MSYFHLLSKWVGKLHNGDISCHAVHSPLSQRANLMPENRKNRLQCAKEYTKSQVKHGGGSLVLRKVSDVTATAR